MSLIGCHTLAGTGIEYPKKKPTWRYIKGDEKDFEGAPDWATLRTRTGVGDFFAESHQPGARVHDVIRKEVFTISRFGLYDESDIIVIAQRELVTSVNDDRLAHDMGLNPKYNRPCKGIAIDVYDVLKAFNVTCPALQHLIKKALAVGQRGHKDEIEDLNDILASAKRAIELSESDK